MARSVSIAEPAVETVTLWPLPRTTNQTVLPMRVHAAPPVVVVALAVLGSVPDVDPSVDSEMAAAGPRNSAVALAASSLPGAAWAGAASSRTPSRQARARRSERGICPGLSADE